MSTNHKPLPDEVEHLLRNAQLRDELEPYFDEHDLHCVDRTLFAAPLSGASAGG